MPKGEAPRIGRKGLKSANKHETTLDKGRNTTNKNKINNYENKGSLPYDMDEKGMSVRKTYTKDKDGGVRKTTSYSKAGASVKPDSKRKFD